MSETTKNRKKTHRERPDFQDVFTSAREADIDILNTNANILPVPVATNQSSTPTPVVVSEPSDPGLPPPPVPSTSNSSKKVVEIPTAKIKTELELKSLSLEAKHPSEKKDLFKAIFDSDDEEDEKETAGVSTASDNNPSQSSLQPALPVRNDFLPKPAAILNVLRNTSPPRGIFSNMFKAAKEPEVATKSDIEPSTSTKPLEEKSNVESVLPAPSIEILYGPSLPTTISIPVTSDFISTNFKEKSRYAADEWIEKSEVDEKDGKKKDKKKHKKVKKHKKEKSKKKKSNKDRDR